MGKATEHLAEDLGEGVGGLLNATFGNAAELIIAFMALRAGLHDVVKASITGSIIGNVLLVLGLSTLAGGLKHPMQRFNQRGAQMSATLLLLAAIGLVIPAIFHQAVAGRDVSHEQELSLEISIILFAAYVLSLVFTLRTHRELYVSDGSPENRAALGTHGWGRGRSLAVLLLATAGVAVMSELLVGAIEHAARSLGLTEVFVGVIVVAIIGNAAEHSTAVLVAMKNKMDLSLNIAIGSSLQVALFVAPVLVFASHALGNPMNLAFTPFEVLAVVVSVFIVNHVVSDGETNWLEGVLLLAVYAILGLAFYFLPA
jgi:Ca2+:H+ antiporter